MAFTSTVISATDIMYTMAVSASTPGHALGVPTYPTLTTTTTTTETSEMSEETWDALMQRLVKDGTIPNPLYRILLFGPPRTGKSSIPKTLFLVHERVTMHKQLPTDDLLGGYALVDGTTKWQDGPAVRAMRKGLCIVIDEIDHVSAECRCILHALMDDPAGITLPTGERVSAKEGYCVIATTNQLPSALPGPVLDRFDLVLKADTLAHGLREQLGQLAKPATAVIARDRSYNWSRPASVNFFIAVSKLRKIGMPDEKIVSALGLSGKTAADALIALAASRR